MDTFQQPKITGYRQLSAEEAALMNTIKAAGADFQTLLIAVTLHIAKQRHEAKAISSIDYKPGEHERIDAAQPERWIAIARTHFQEGLMALTRAVAQPGSF